MRIVEDKRNTIRNQIRDIEYQLESKRAMAQRLRLDQILIYEEASITHNCTGA